MTAPTLDHEVARKWGIDWESADLLAALMAFDEELNHHTVDERNMGRAFFALREEAKAMRAYAVHQQPCKYAGWKAEAIEQSATCRCGLSALLTSASAGGG